MARSLPKSPATRGIRARSPANNGKVSATAAGSGRRKTPAPAVAADKPKMVRDRFTLPQVDHDRLVALKSRMRGIGHPTKKNALLRVGLLMLSALSDDTLRQLLDQLPPAKAAKPVGAGKRGKRAPD